MPLFPTAPIRSTVFPTDASGRRRIRDIDNRYRMALLERSRDELERFAAAQLGFQAQRALELWSGDSGNRELLQSILRSINSIGAGARSPAFGADALSGVLEAEVRRITSEMEALRAQLGQVIEEARSRYPARVYEDRLGALSRLRMGMEAGGSEGAEDLGAALRLLNAIVRDLNGGQDGAVWFEIGWLHWNHSDDLPAAEHAFTRALERSGLDGGSATVMAVRHLAHIRYLRGDVAGAWECILDTPAVYGDLGVRYDRARYAFPLDRDDEVEELLLSCISERPSILLAMLSDEDFSGSPERVASIAVTATGQARDRVTQRVGDLGVTVQRLVSACERAGSPPATAAAAFQDRASRMVARLNITNILQCASVVEEAEELGREALDSARKALNTKAAEESRQEKAVRATLNSAAAERAKAVSKADKALAASMKAAEKSTMAEARQTAGWSLVLNLAIVGVVVGVVAAVLAMKLSPDGDRQNTGLLLALGLTLGVPLVLYAFGKSVDPGISDWLRLAAAKEFGKEFPRKAEVLQAERAAAVAEADRRYAQAAGAAQKGLDSITERVRMLDAAQDRIELLRTRAAL